MATLGPRAVIPAPPLEAWRVDLRSSARIVEESNNRWQMGIAYSPERPLGGSSVDPRSDGVGEGVKTTTDSPNDVEWDPYVIWAGDQCSALGSDFEDIRARAERQLEVQTSHLIEGILWTNLVDGVSYGAPNHPNIGLSSNGSYQPNGFTVSPFLTGWSEVIKRLGDYLGGARGMIHVERRLLPFISFYGLAIREGNRLVTTLGDHIVVPGSGYTGSAPGNNASGEYHSWLYGTSMVELRLGAIEVFFDRTQSLNRSTNEFEYRAERIALAHWDRNAWIALSVCLEDPAGGCSDSAS